MDVIEGEREAAVSGRVAEDHLTARFANVLLGGTFDLHVGSWAVFLLIEGGLIESRGEIVVSHLLEPGRPEELSSLFRLVRTL